MKWSNRTVALQCRRMKKNGEKIFESHIMKKIGVITIVLLLSCASALYAGVGGAVDVSGPVNIKNCLYLHSYSLQG